MGYSTGSFNPKDPRFQREIQKMAARRSMGTGGFDGRGRISGSGVLRSRIGEVTGRHAGHQLGRQQQFVGLAHAARSNEMADAQRLASFAHQGRLTGLGEKKLSNQKKNFNLSMLLGGAGSIYSMFEGRRRSDILREENRIQNLRADARVESYERAIRGRLGTDPLPGFSHLP
jgi:hypothetical protein